MYKKLFTIGFAIFALIAVTACSNVDLSLGENSAEAKTEAYEGERPTFNTNTVTEPSEPKQEETPVDIWTTYPITWEDDFEGLLTKISIAGVSDIIPNRKDPDGPLESAVSVRFYIENTTTGLFTTYPDQATLVTSTGEQIEASPWYSDHIGGEIDEGVIKEGAVTWFLERGHAADIKWIKLRWNAYKGDSFSNNKENVVKLQLHPQTSSITE